MRLSLPKSVSAFAIIGLSLGATLVQPTAAHAQRFRGGFHRSPAFSQAGVFGQHLNSIAFSRSPAAIAGVAGRVGMYGATMSGYNGGGGVSLDAGAVSEILKAQSDAAKAEEQAKQAKKDRERQIIEERQLELARNLRTAQESEREDLYRRSFEDPAQPSIMTGWALNDLYSEIVQVQRETGLHGPDIPVPNIDPKRVNYTGSEYGGGFGLFKTDKPLAWPGVLSAEVFREGRGYVDAAIKPALAEVGAGAKETKAVKALSLAISGMRDRLKEQGDEISSLEYIKAIEYLQQLEESAIALTQKNAPQLLSGALSAGGANIADWVQDMVNKGLKFAPAAPAEATTYAELYQALLNYTIGLNRMANRQ